MNPALPLLRQTRTNRRNCSTASARVVDYLVGMANKTIQVAAPGYSEVADSFFLTLNAVVTGPADQEFQYWVGRYGLSGQHIKLLIPCVGKEPIHTEKSC